MLEQLNNNFALIQNSPYFKGVPGDQGEPGEKGNTGLRGTKIFAANFDKFKAQFPELVNQSISTLNAEWLNAKLETDTNNENYNKILVALNADELLEDDIVLFQSDLSLWTYDQDNNQFLDSGVRFASDSNAKNIIDSLIKTSLDEYIGTLEQATMYVKEYPTISSNDGKRGTEYSRINTITTYFPYLAKARVPSKYDVTTPNIPIAKKHKYFAIDDDYTNIGNDYSNSDPIGITTIVGSVREYIRTLQNGTEQTLAGNIVNPTYDKMPAMVVMQNNYKSGLVIGHNQSPTMANYGVIYKNAEGQFCFRREHRWPASRRSEQVTEFIIGAGEFLFNGTLNLLTGQTMWSDFLDTLTTPNTVRIGYGNKAGNILSFDALSYKFSNIPAKSVLELDSNGNLMKADQRTLSGIKYLHQVHDNVISDSDSEERKTWFDRYYRPESEYYDKNNLLHGLTTEYTSAMMYDCIQDQLDEVWRKNEFFVEEFTRNYSSTTLTKFTDKIPSLHLHEKLVVSSSKTTKDDLIQKVVNFYNPLQVETLTPYGGANDNLKIGLYYKETTTKPGLGTTNDTNRGTSAISQRERVVLERMQSLLNIELDWNKVILRAMPAYSVFAVDENQELSSAYQFANPYSEYEEEVYQDLAARLDSDDFKFPNSFDKYAEDSWYDSDMVQHGGYSGTNPSVRDEERFLTGRHFVTIMRIIGTVVSWIKDTFARKEDLEKIANDIVPDGAIIAWNPPITSYNYISNALGNGTGTNSGGEVSPVRMPDEPLRAPAQQEVLQNTVMSIDGNTEMVEISQGTSTGKTTATQKAANSSLAPKAQASADLSTKSVAGKKIQSPTELSAGLGSVTKKNGLSTTRFSAAKAELPKSPSATLVDTGKYLALSSMDSNVDFKLPLGWVPCIGKSLYEVSGCSASNIGTIHAIYRVPDLRDKIVIGYYWESTSNINEPYITGNANYQPDSITLENKTIIPSSAAASMYAKSNLGKAPTLMSTTTGSKYADVDTIKGIVLSSSVETEDYFVSNKENQILNNSDKNKVDKFRYCPPAVRLCYIMKAPKPASGHALYMKLTEDSYMRIYPLPNSADYDTSQYPFYISTLTSEVGSSIIAGRFRTTIIDDVPAEIIDTPGSVRVAMTDVEKFTQIVEDNKSEFQAQGNGMVINEVDTSKLSESEKNQMADLLGKMGIETEGPQTLVIGTQSGRKQEANGNSTQVNNPQTTLLSGENTKTTTTGTQDSVQTNTEVVVPISGKKAKITRKRNL